MPSLAAGEKAMASGRALKCPWRDRLGIKYKPGDFHAEQNIGAQLPENSTVVRWGISHAESQKPYPCTNKGCAVMIEHIGGVIEGVE